MHEEYLSQKAFLLELYYAGILSARQYALLRYQLYCLYIQTVERTAHHA